MSTASCFRKSSRRPDSSSGVDSRQASQIQPNDDSLQFRIAGCKYRYNPATRSLSGAGSYSVSAPINPNPAGVSLTGFPLNGYTRVNKSLAWTWSITFLGLTRANMK